MHRAILCRQCLNAQKLMKICGRGELSFSWKDSVQEILIKCKFVLYGVFTGETLSFYLYVKKNALQENSMNDALVEMDRLHASFGKNFSHHL
jgi:hypothetical protein